jgi:predicted ATPase
VSSRTISIVLTRIQAANFKSLGDRVDLRLEAFTALVGINGAGKSNVVEIPRFLAHALRDGLDAAMTSRGNMRALGRWSGGRPFDVWLRIDVSDGDASGFFDLRLGSQDGGDGYKVLREEAEWRSGERETARYVVERSQWTGPDGLSPRLDPGGLALPLVAADERFKALHDGLRSVAIYSIFPAVLRSPQQFDPTAPMLEHGENWATALRAVVRQRDLQTELRAAMNAVTGDIENVRVRGVGTFLSPQFLHASPPEHRSRKLKWFDAGQESDGTLRIAGILTALLQRPAPGLLGIEEPELTVHPGALPVIHDYLLEASRRGQVVITTHSPDLLDLIAPESIYVVERKQGTTSVSRMDHTQQQLVRDHLTSPGELLRIEGVHAA